MLQQSSHKPQTLLKALCVTEMKCDYIIVAIAIQATANNALKRMEFLMLKAQLQLHIFKCMHTCSTGICPHVIVYIIVKSIM